MISGLLATLSALNAIAFAGVSPQLPRAARLPNVPPCTTVAVAMLDTIDSATAHLGDFFRFETVTAISDGQRVVVPAHTIGYGVVSVASAAGSGGRAGTLVLEPEYLVLPNKIELGVVLDHYAGDMMSSGRSGELPGYLGMAPLLGAAIGLFNAFHHGQNVVVKKGTKFSIFPADGPQTQRCQQHPG